MFLSVVMPSLNSSLTIEAQLRALLAQSWSGDWEIIIADNGSTDGTRAIVERYCANSPRLRLIDASARRGAAYARNAGVRAARGEVVAFCDADDEVTPDWVAAMASALERHDFVASRMDVTKLNPEWLAKSLNNVQGKELRRTFYPPYLKHAGSSGMGIKRAIHETVGGFDESLPQREDTDYCFRLQLQGVDLFFASDALIHVRYRESSKALFRQAREWGYYYELLYKRYGRGPIPHGHCWGGYLWTWWVLLRTWRRLFSSETRPAWMKAAGTQVGLLQGAIRFGVPPICEPTATLSSVNSFMVASAAIGLTPSSSLHARVQSSQTQGTTQAERETLNRTRSEKREWVP